MKTDDRFPVSFLIIIQTVSEKSVLPDSFSEIPDNGRNIFIAGLQQRLNVRERRTDKKVRKRTDKKVGKRTDKKVGKRTDKKVRKRTGKKVRKRTDKKVGSARTKRSESAQTKRSESARAKRSERRRINIRGSSLKSVCCRTARKGRMITRKFREFFRRRTENIRKFLQTAKKERKDEDI